jgi:L-ascorbate metabolism protein UlaG (beta-lactamase superfamily)
MHSRSSLIRLSGGWGAALLLCAAGIAAQMASDKIPATGGDILITAISHASVRIEFGGTVIHVDPVGAANYAQAPAGDLVLVTHAHGDHLDPAVIAKVRKAGAPVVASADAAPKIDGAIVMANGDARTVAGVPIEAVAAYNLVRERAPGQPFHPKGAGNGYVLTLGGKRVYFSGDTECTPEMKALKNIDAAFISMNLPYTMPPSEAAECARAFRPRILYPYHYRGQNLDELVAALKGEPIDVRRLNWYPGM